MHEVAVVVRKNGRVLMRQCGAGERWAGLWDFPRFAIEAEGPLFAEKEIVTKVREQTGITCRLGPLHKDNQARRHALSHHARLLPRTHMLPADRKQTQHRSPLGHAFELADLPLSTHGRNCSLSRSGEDVRQERTR